MGGGINAFSRSDAKAVRLPARQEAELLEALDEADWEEGISAEELLARLRRFGSPWLSSSGSSPAPGAVRKVLEAALALLVEDYGLDFCPLSIRWMKGCSNRLP